MATTTAPTTPAAAEPPPATPRAASPSTRAASLAWAVMIILILITLFPFYWMLRTSLSTSNSLFLEPGKLGPVDFTLGALQAGPRPGHDRRGPGRGRVRCRRSTSSSTCATRSIFAVSATAGQVFFSALAAYAFARLQWPGRNMVFFVFLTALMIPTIFTALPNFVLIKNLGLLDTFPGWSRRTSS